MKKRWPVQDMREFYLYTETSNGGTYTELMEENDFLEGKTPDFYPDLTEDEE